MLNNVYDAVIVTDVILYYKIMHSLTPWTVDRYFNTAITPAILV